MIASASATTEMRACPRCRQQTAVAFLRSVGRKQLCVLCAQRTADEEKAFRETVEDRKLHGGHKWLWKHIAFVVAGVISYLLVRGIISEALRSAIR